MAHVPLEYRSQRGDPPCGPAATPNRGSARWWSRPQRRRTIPASWSPWARWRRRPRRAGRSSIPRCAGWPSRRSRLHIGCSWCVDYGYYEGMNEGIDPEKVRAAARWRESTLFDERERLVLEYAEQPPRAPPAEVSDELADRLHLPLQRRRDRRAGGLGGAGELPLPVQCRTGAAQPGLRRPVRGASAGQDHGASSVA